MLTMRRLDLRKAQAARLNTIRDINRQIVLNYVREREPISRAEIARPGRPPRRHESIQLGRWQTLAAGAP